MRIGTSLCLRQGIQHQLQVEGWIEGGTALLCCLDFHLVHGPLGGAVHRLFFRGNDDELGRGGGGSGGGGGGGGEGGGREGGKVEGGGGDGEDGRLKLGLHLASRDR